MLTFALPMVLVGGLAITAYLVFFSDRSPAPPSIATSSFGNPVRAARKAESLDELLKISPEQLKNADIAEMNLLCATGLRGAENLNIGHALATLDEWAARVKFETERHLYRVTDSRYADHYRHSEACLRAEMLLQVLQQDLGIKYDRTAAHSFAFNDSRVAFIHGMIPMPGQTIAETLGGTCASMPVMYVAVGRRLGYPLKLVTSKGHVFVRWEGKDHPNPAWRERFNIEGSGDGFGSYDDEHYKTWPFKLTDREVQVNGYLVSLTPMEEFAQFLAARGHCGLDNGQAAFAARCYENAYRYDQRRPCYRAWFADAASQSGYRPSTPALASLLAHRMDPAAAAERIIGWQQMAARREWLRGQAGGAPAPGLPNGISAGRSYQSPTGTPRQPSPYGPQPGIPQPYQPPMPGVPPGPSPYGPQPGTQQPVRPPMPGQPPK